jgi:hypothetical protein
MSRAREHLSPNALRQRRPAWWSRLDPRGLDRVQVAVIAGTMTLVIVLTIALDWLVRALGAAR